MAKIHGKSQFRGLNSAYWSVFFRPKNGSLGLGVILFKKIIFEFFGSKSRIFGPKMAKIHGKSQFRGPNSAYWSVFPS